MDANDTEYKAEKAEETIDESGYYRTDWFGKPAPAVPGSCSDRIPAALTVTVDPAGQTEKAPFENAEPSAGARMPDRLTAKTISDAVGLVTEWRRRAGYSPETDILLRPGTHRIASPLRLGPDLSFTRFRSADPAHPARIDGGINIPARDFGRLGECGEGLAYASRIPESVRGSVRTVDLKRYGIRREDVPSLSDRSGFGIQGTGVVLGPASAEAYEFMPSVAGKSLRFARYPDGENEMLPTGGGKIAEERDGGMNLLRFPLPKENAEELRGWKSFDGVRVFGYFRFLWQMFYCDASGFDAENDALLISAPTDSTAAGLGYYLYNAPEALTSPGEFCIDGDGVLYFLPCGGFEENGLDLSFSRGPMFSFENASDVSFENLTLANTSGAVLRWNGDRLFVGGCEFRNVGSQAVYALGCQNTVRDSRFEEIGWGCVLLAGGDPIALRSGENIVAGCHFTRWGQIKRTYAPAVCFDGVGSCVLGCVMHDAPHAAVSYLGNGHLIEKNEIYDVCTYSDDCGAIYTGRRYDCGGTAIRYNYIHDVVPPDPKLGAMAVYLDDCDSWQAVYGNIVRRVRGHGMMIGGGRENYICDNLFIDCTNALQYDARGWSGRFQEGHWYDCNEYSLRMLRLKPFFSARWEEKFPRISTMSLELFPEDPHDPDFFASPSHCLVRRNFHAHSASDGFTPAVIPDQVYEFSAARPPEEILLPDSLTDAEQRVKAAVAAAKERGIRLSPEEENDTPEKKAARLVETAKRRGAKIATAESCTGGLIGSLITSVPGASDVYDGGAVSYANRIKMKILGVKEETLASVGAVSQETAEQMALGALRIFCPEDDGSRERSFDAAVAVTGIAGPGGGTPEKPVGTVWIGIATRRGAEAKRFLFVPSGEDGRASIRSQTAAAALELLTEALG